MTSVGDLAGRMHRRWLEENPFTATMAGIPGYDDLVPNESEAGIHAYGWSRERALEFMAEHVPMPREFLADEIDRYVVMPGQALAYLTGKLEILRIRDDARQRLGPAFSLPAFHGAVLDHGSLPMPTLARSITHWLGQAG
jgi:uncharacterized protein (DUF885 family)